MKKIEAVIRKSKYSEIKKALKENGVTFYTYWDVTGIGHETQEHVYRGIVYDASDIQRRYISIIVNDDFEKITIDTIMQVARTGELGDGKIFVSDIVQVYSIRTGEKGGETLRK